MLAGEMAPNKKRKLDDAPAPPGKQNNHLLLDARWVLMITSVMSAVALRRKRLEERAAQAKPMATKGQDSPAGSTELKAPETPRKGRRRAVSPPSRPLPDSVKDESVQTPEGASESGGALPPKPPARSPNGHPYGYLWMLLLY